jgi:hypothetical protein
LLLALPCMLLLKTYRNKMLIPAYTHFLKSFFIFCMAMAIPVFIISFFIQSPLFSHTLPLQFIFFIVITGTLHYFFIKNMEKKPQQFVTTYLGLTGLKLFIYLIIIVGYFITNKNDAVSFILSFLFFYLAFTAFEVFSLLKSSRAQINS